MKPFFRNPLHILTSKWFAVALISFLLSCLSIFPITNASAQPCDWNWDILSISGIKTNYQPGETISGNISFRLHNKANSGAIQQLLIGIIDLQNKVIDVKCVYNGAPKDCPEWTTGTASFSLKAPVTPGNYKVIAADDLENSCSDAINRFPSLCSSTSPYCKDITTITISASPSPPPTEGDTATGSSGSGWIQNLILPEVGSIILFIFIACAVGLVVFLLIRFCQRIIIERRTLFEKVCKAIEKYRPPGYSPIEMPYQWALCEYLRNKFPTNKVDLETRTEDGARPDITIDNIAIEVKGPTGANDLYTLIQKCYRVGKHYQNIIFVLFAPKYRTQKLEEVKKEIRRSYPKINACFISK